MTIFMENDGKKLTSAHLVFFFSLAEDQEAT